MNEETLEKIADCIEEAEKLIDALKQEAPKNRAASWKSATESLAMAAVIANQARVKARYQMFVRRMILAHVGRLTNELREVEL